MRISCALIIKNRDGKFLLQLRDNIPSISFPDCWAFFGGVIEKGETPEEAMVREIKEELDYDLEDFKFLRTFEWPGHKEYIFLKENFDKTTEELTLLEGTDFAFFSEEDIKTKLKCLPSVKKILDII